jgi:hypothetical protein
LKKWVIEKSGTNRAGMASVKRESGMVEVLEDTSAPGLRTASIFS